MGERAHLLSMICHNWAQDASWLARFDIVVLAYLRDEVIQNASLDLADILPAHSSHSQRTVPQALSIYGEGVILFDGWDSFHANS